MADHALVAKWQAMQTAIGAEDWAELAHVARELEGNLRRLADGRSRKDHSVHRDGLFAIGWQRVMRAPRDVRRVVDRYNTTLRRLPGGVGPQPPR